MNSLRRALGAFAATDSPAFILRSYSAAAITTAATATRRRSKPLSPPPTTPPQPPADAAVPEVGPRPTEIPFQPKVANAVNLIGHVHMPVQFQTSPDGKSWAATVIMRQESRGSPYVWIPVIFEGDLAHIAACHLRENDCIHIAGQLSTDPPHLDIKQGQSNIQVMVQSLNFVQGYPQVQNISEISKQEKMFSSSASVKHDINQSWKDIHSKQSEENDIDKSWKDLLSNPDEWWDIRSTEDNKKGGAFERKTNGELLFIDSSTPKWLHEKLESMTVDLKAELKGSITGAKKDLDPLLSSWRDLLHDPKQWRDFRDRKLNGLVNPKYPDFKRKDGSVSLWLNRAPKWVLSELKGLEFDIPVIKSEQAKESKGDQSWSDLVKNPDKWWDNRPNKKNERSPDFKHKETGEALWLNRSPSWALSKLPPLKPKQSVETGSTQTLVSRA